MDKIEVLAKVNKSLSDKLAACEDEKAILSKENDVQKDTIAKLEVLVTKREVELEKFKNECEKAENTFTKLNKSKMKLDEAITMGQLNKTGLSFEKGNFVKEGCEASTSKSVEKPKSKEKSFLSENRPRRRHYICHYCFAPGHIM